MPHKFPSTLTRPEGAGTWTYLDIPAEASASLGAKGQIKVRGTLDGEPFRGTLMSGGEGRHFLVVNKTLRDRIGKTVGDVVSVELERDDEPRELAILDDFQAALSLNEAASARFEKMSPSHKKQYLDHIDEAKAAETRMRRIDKSVAMIAEGKNLK